jgi:hypothetical protein
MSDTSKGRYPCAFNSARHDYSVVKFPLMVLGDTLGCRLQLIVPPENVLPCSLPLRCRLCRTEILDKERGIDYSTKTRGVAPDMRPNGSELIFTGTPGTSCKEAFATGLD